MTQKRQKNLLYIIRQALLAHWDPIGVHDFRIGDDEYDSYIPSIISMLEMGVDNEGIARYLSRLRTESIGLSPNTESDAYAACLLTEAYEGYRQSLASDTGEAASPGISRKELAFEVAKYAFSGLSIEEMQSVINRLIEDNVYHDTFFDVIYPEDSVTELVGPAFEKALGSLGVPISNHEDAIWVIIYYYLQKIVNREVDPYEGLKQFMYEVYWKYDFYARAETYLGDSHRVELLISLFWAYDDLMDKTSAVSINGKYGEAAVAELKNEIFAEAKRWVSDFTYPQT